MDTIALISISSAIVIGASIAILFVAYLVNQMTVKNVNLSQANLAMAQLLLQAVQQYKDKYEAEALYGRNELQRSGIHK